MKLITLVLTLGLCACAESPPAIGPRAAVSNATADFGIIAACNAVSRRFEVRNAGGLPLQLDFAGGGCGIRATPAAARVLPGESATFEVGLDTCNLSGTVTRSIAVFTNDPTQRTLNLALRGRVDAEVAVVPPSMYLGHLRRGQDAVLDAKLLSQPGLSVRIASTDNPFVEAQVRPAARGTTAQRLHLRIRHDAPYGHFQAAVRLQSTGKQRPTLDVPVIGFVDQG